MVWLVIFGPLILVILLAAYFDWKGKKRRKQYNLEHRHEEHLSEKNQMNNAAAMVNAKRDFNSGGGGGL